MVEDHSAADTASQQVLEWRFPVAKCQNPTKLVCQPSFVEFYLTCCCKVSMVYQLTSICQHSVSFI